jgi:hypothetical protein
MAQWVKAPVNQTTGSMRLSFDFFYNNWDPAVTSDMFRIEVYGSNFAPPHNIGFTWSPVSNSYNSGVGSMVRPTGGKVESFDYSPEGVQYHSQMLGRFGWGDVWTNSVGDPESGGWKHIDSANPTAGWTEIDPADQGSLIIPVNLTETFDYYSVTVYTRVYAENHSYFWMVPGYGVVGYDAARPGPAIGFDNIDFRLSLIPEPASIAWTGCCGIALLRRRR